MSLSNTVAETTLSQGELEIAELSECKDKFSTAPNLEETQIQPLNDAQELAAAPPTRMSFYKYQMLTHKVGMYWELVSQMQMGLANMQAGLVKTTAVSGEAHKTSY